MEFDSGEAALSSAGGRGGGSASSSVGGRSDGVGEKTKQVRMSRSCA
jgi:hypothetical protein